MTVPRLLLHSPLLLLAVIPAACSQMKPTVTTRTPRPIFGDTTSMDGNRSRAKPNDLSEKTIMDKVWPHTLLATDRSTCDVDEEIYASVKVGDKHRCGWIAQPRSGGA